MEPRPRTSIKTPVKKGDWVTNYPKPIDKWKFKRKNIKYREGLPKATNWYSIDEFIEMGYVGIYLDEDVDSYETEQFEFNEKDG